jgi:hypothetical protein
MKERTKQVAAESVDLVNDLTVGLFAKLLDWIDI